MAQGDSLPMILSGLGSPEIEMVKFHLDAGTSAQWLTDTLNSHGIKVGTSTIKAYRRQIKPAPLTPRGDEIILIDLYNDLVAKRATIEDAAAKASKPNILTIDIERVPGRFEADFWDMNAMKGRRISPEWVKSWPRTICVAAKWHGEDEMKFFSEWGEGRDGMIRATWSLLEEADIVVTQNGKRFDIPHLRGDWNEIGLPDPSPFKIVDTLTIARSRFSFESNTLSALCERFGVPTKTDKYDPNVAKAALDGDEDAQKRLQSYNEGDIIATEALYDAMRMRGWITNHPPMAPGHKMRCPSCGGGKIIPLPQPYRAEVHAYLAYRCEDCKTILRGRKGNRMTDLRGVRS